MLYASRTHVYVCLAISHHSDPKRNGKTNETNVKHIECDGFYGKRISKYPFICESFAFARRPLAPSLWNNGELAGFDARFPVSKRSHTHPTWCALYVGKCAAATAEREHTLDSLMIAMTFDIIHFTFISLQLRSSEKMHFRFFLSVFFSSSACSCINGTY